MEVLTRPPARTRLAAHRSGAASLALLTLAGCLRDPVDVTQQGSGVVMVGLVGAATDTGSVVLARMESRQRPETGATLRLETPHGSVELAERPGDACGLTRGWACYRGAYVAPPRTGESYRIRGALADGTRVSGVTTIPAPPLVVYHDGPDAGSPVADTLRVTELRTPFMELERAVDGSWVSIVGGEAPADVWTPSGRVTCRSFVFATFFNLQSARFAIGVREPLCGGAPVPWDSMAVEVRLQAFDPSFSSYWKRTRGITQALFPHEAAWGVEGVLGVFGSSAPRRLVVITSNPAS